MTSQCRGLRGTPRRFGGRSVEMHSLSMNLDLHHSANAVEGGSQIRFPMYLWHLNIYEKRGQRCRRKIQPTKGRSFSEKPLDTDKGGHTLEFTLPTIPKQPVMLSTEKGIGKNQPFPSLHFSRLSSPYPPGSFKALLRKATTTGSVFLNLSNLGELDRCFERFTK